MNSVLDAILAAGTSSLPREILSATIPASMYRWQPSPPQSTENQFHGALSNLGSLPARKRVPLRIVDPATGFEVKVGPPTDTDHYIQPSTTASDATSLDFSYPNSGFSTTAVPEFENFPDFYKSATMATMAEFEHPQPDGTWDVSLATDHHNGWSQPYIALNETEMSAWSPRQAATEAAVFQCHPYPYPYPYPSSPPYAHPAMTPDEMGGAHTEWWWRSDQTWDQEGWSEGKEVGSEDECEGEEGLCPPGMEEVAQLGDTCHCMEVCGEEEEEEREGVLWRGRRDVIGRKGQKSSGKPRRWWKQD